MCYKFALSLLKSTDMGKRISLQKKLHESSSFPSLPTPYLGKKVNAVVLAKTYTQLENAKVELDAPFSKADELAEKEAGLNDSISCSTWIRKTGCLMDDTPDEGQNELPKSRDYER